MRPELGAHRADRIDDGLLAGHVTAESRRCRALTNLALRGVHILVEHYHCGALDCVRIDNCRAYSRGAPVTTATLFARESYPTCDVMSAPYLWGSVGWINVLRRRRFLRHLALH